jgi:hypothetical protein
MLWTALATAPTVLGTFEIKALIIRSGRFRPSTIAISGTVSGACGHHSPQPLVVPYPDRLPVTDPQCSRASRLGATSREHDASQLPDRSIEVVTVGGSGVQGQGGERS